MRNTASTKKFSFRIASDVSKEKVFAEIFYDGQQWAELSQETETPVIVIFGPLDADYWEFPLDEALSVIEKAKKELIRE